MAKELIIGGETSIALASNRGWSNVIDAVELSELEMPTLEHLIEYGWTEPNTRLAEEIRSLLATDLRQDVRDTLAPMAEHLEASGDAESAVVTDGFAPDDGQEDYVQSFNPANPDADEPTP